MFYERALLLRICEHRKPFSADATYQLPSSVRSKFTPKSLADQSQLAAGVASTNTSSDRRTPICYTMELSHSLTLNEEAYKKVPDQQKPVFLFEWLRYLDKVLVVAQKVSAQH